MSDQNDWKNKLSGFNKDETQIPFIVDEHFKRFQSESFIGKSEAQEFRDNQNKNDVGLIESFDIQALETPAPEVGDD